MPNISSPWRSPNDQTSHIVSRYSFFETSPTPKSVSKSVRLGQIRHFVGHILLVIQETPSNTTNRGARHKEIQLWSSDKYLSLRNNVFRKHPEIIGAILKIARHIMQIAQNIVRCCRSTAFTNQPPPPPGLQTSSRWEPSDHHNVQSHSWPRMLGHASEANGINRRINCISRLIKCNCMNLLVLAAISYLIAWISS